MDFIYFLAFWGVFLTICGIIALATSKNNNKTQESAC